jgi:hypothetical protein
MTKKRKSRAVEIDMSNLDFVPRPSRRKCRPATIEEYAELEFEPWQREPGMGASELMPSMALMRDLGVSARLAYALMLMSKRDMSEAIEKMGEDLADSLFGGILNAAERFKEIAQMCEAAEARFLVAGSTLALQEESPRSNSSPAAGAFDTESILRHAKGGIA